MQTRPLPPRSGRACSASTAGASTSVASTRRCAPRGTASRAATASRICRPSGAPSSPRGSSWPTCRSSPTSRAPRRSRPTRRTTPPRPSASSPARPRRPRSSPRSAGLHGSVLRRARKRQAGEVRQRPGARAFPQAHGQAAQERALHPKLGGDRGPLRRHRLHAHRGPVPEQARQARGPRRADPGGSDGRVSRALHAARRRAHARGLRLDRAGLGLRPRGARPRHAHRAGAALPVQVPAVAPHGPRAPARAASALTARRARCASACRTSR